MDWLLRHATTTLITVCSPPGRYRINTLELARLSNFVPNPEGVSKEGLDYQVMPCQDRSLLLLLSLSLLLL